MVAGLPLNGLLKALSSLQLSDPSATGELERTSTESSDEHPTSPVYGVSHWSASTLDATTPATPADANGSTEQVALSGVEGDAGKAELERRLDALAQQALAPTFGFGAHDLPGESEVHDGDDEADSDTFSIMSGRSTLGQSDETRMEMLKAEFGTLDYAPTEERFLAEVQGALIAGVLVIGRLFVTSQRVAFYAVLPKLEEDLAAKRSNIIKAGPMRTLIPGYRNQRVWTVLSRDEFAIYRSSKDLYRPIASLPLVSVYEVLDADPTEETVVRTRILKRFPTKPSKVFVAKLWCDTKEAADDWRREMAAALFDYINVRDRFRVSVPFDRMVNIERTVMPAGNFGVKFTFDVTADGSSEGSTPRSPSGSGFGQAELTKTLHFGVCPSDDTDVAGLLAKAWQDVKTQRDTYGTRLTRSAAPIIDIFEPPKPPSADTEVDDDPDVWSHQISLTEEPESIEEDTHDMADDTPERDEAKFTKRKQRLDAAFGLLPEELLNSALRYTEPV